MLTCAWLTPYLFSEMQKQLPRDTAAKARRLQALADATDERERADDAQVVAAHHARNAGATWREIAEVASKGSASAAASYFGDSMVHRAEIRAAARMRAR